MPSLDLRVLVLERWRRAWDDDWSQRSFVYGGGSGAGGRVALWQTASALTSDPELYYDSSTNRLGIGTTTPTAPLTFSNALGPKIDIWYAAGAGRYGIGLQGGQMQIYADLPGFVHLGNTDAAGTTFTSRLYVGTSIYASVPLGASWPIQANYELTTNRLYVAGVSYYGQPMGIGVTPGAYTLDVNGSFHAVTASRFDSAVTMYSLRLGDHVAPGYTLDVNGMAYLRSTLGVVGNTVIGPGSLQVSGNVLYTDGIHGVVAQGSGAFASTTFAHLIRGNPSWADFRLMAWHEAGIWAGFRLDSTAGNTNYYDLRMSGGNAYIALGAWIDAPSDRAVKRAITPIDAPLARLAKLHGSHYERTDLAGALEGFPAPNPFEYGLIAQDVAEALPDAAFEYDYGEERGKLWNYYDRPILALLVESVKALAQRVEALEAGSG